MRPIERIVLGTISGLSLLALSACGEQDPSFTETSFRDSAAEAANAQAKKADETVAEEGAAGQDGANDSVANTSAGSSGGNNSAGTDTTGDGSQAGVGGGGTDSNGDEILAFDEGGVTITKVTQNFVQASTSKVDILWVIDTSGSMSEEQNYLGSNFNAFINGLAASDVDFQTAVTTTDICDNTIPTNLALRSCPVDYGGSSSTHLRGSFVGTSGRKVLKHTDSDLVSKFNTYVNQGVNGSGFEHGLKAAEMAISKSISGTNETLLRPDSFLSVIVVSDEEDDGIGLGMLDTYTGRNFVQEGATTYRYTHNDFIQSLHNMLGGGKFSVSTITGTRNQNGSLCSAPHSQPREEGTQYINAAGETGGVVQSICDTNWSASLAQMGADLGAQITQLNLSHNPDVPTIKVFVNGTLDSRWSYVAANNAVKFDADAVPTAGAEIKVEYIVQ